MYGDAFVVYRLRVPAILPRLTPARLDIEGVRHSHFEWGWVLRNKEFKTWIAIAALFGLLALRSLL